MNIFFIVLVAIAAYFLSVFGFSQIIGSIQNAKTRGFSMTFATIIIWASILFCGWFLMDTFASEYCIAYYIASAVGFLQIVGAGKIK